MPLIVLCGYPSSGKTRRAAEIAEAIVNKANCKMHTVSNHSNKFCVYSDSRLEKDLRGSLKSEVQRLLSPDCVVILDAPNYIKGYRYELYCISKAAKTTHCVVHCDTSSQQSWTLNTKRDESEKYSRDLFDALVMRFESPDSNQRWDKPLITIQSEDDLPIDEIQDALFGRHAPPPNKSTEQNPALPANFLHILDKITQDIVNKILDSQKYDSGVDFVKIDGSEETVSLLRPLLIGELSRLRRQFLTYIKAHPISSKEQVPSMFVHYINSTLTA